MKKVGIVGLGMTPFKSKWATKTYYALAQMAAKEAFKDAGLSPKEVDSVVFTIYNDIFERTAIPEHPLQGIVGMMNKPGLRVTNGGATGGYGLRAAFAEVASGLSDTVMILGVEKATDCFDFQSMTETPEVIKTIAWSGDSFFEQPLGWTAADSYAEIVLAYMDHYPQFTEEVTAWVSVWFSQNALKNPYAQRHDPVTHEEVMNSRYVVYPFKLMDCCVYSEGSVALIIAEEEKARSICRSMGHPVVWITGVAAANEHSFVGKEAKILHRIESDYIAGKKAYAMAGIKDPLNELQVAEIHDAFGPQALITGEELGFCLEGKAHTLVTERIVAPDGKVPFNLSGGLLYCGHAVGATGLFSVLEVARQCRHTSPNQRPDVHRGIAHGTGSTLAQYATVFILERGE
jgi:acetyl-CoA C-acetyltransferase